MLKRAMKWTDFTKPVHWIGNDTANNAIDLKKNESMKLFNTIPHYYTVTYLLLLLLLLMLLLLLLLLMLLL